MYKYSDKMIFNEDESYINSLSLMSGKKVNCVCPFCGKERLLAFYGVVRHNSTACTGCSYMDRKFREAAGKRFGRLVVLSPAGISNNKQLVSCKCDCGKVVVVKLAAIKSGTTKSCGCYKHDELVGRNGEKHHNFGKKFPNRARPPSKVSPEQRELAIKERRNSEAVRFRRAVRERDGACVICDSTKNLVVHHLENFKNNELLRYEVSNGVTLCRACHVEFHTVFLGGYHVPCTEQDFNDYVSQI